MPNRQNITNNKAPKKLYYFIAFLVIAFSALNYFKGQSNAKIIISVYALFLYFSQRERFDKKIILVLLIVFIIISAQLVLFGGGFFTLFTYITFGFLVPYFLLKKIGLNFPKYVTDVIFVYAIISLIFWLFSNVSPSFYEWTSTLAERLGTDPQNMNYEFHGRPEQFILYTFEPGRAGIFVRNPGPFHEPGAFAVFLIFGLIFNTLISRRFVSWRNLILSIALLTTFSTSGYLSFLLLVSFSVVVSNLPVVRKLSLFLLLAFISYVVYIENDFLSEKITNQYTEQTNVSLENKTSGRFLGARKAIYVLSKYPLTGRGIFVSMKSETDTREDAAYGFMSVASRIGIPAILLFFFFFYNGLKQYCYYYSFNPKFAIYAFAALLIVLFAQDFLMSILFMMILYSAVINSKFGYLKFKSDLLKSKHHSTLQIKT
jgi:hypothetical protein